MSILNDELKKFEYYVKKIPLYLKQSHGVIDQYQIWHNLLTGYDFQPTLDVDAELNAESVGKMYKYVGQTNETYTYGHIYKINEIRRYQVIYFVNGGTGNVPIDSTRYAPGDTVTVDFNTLPTPVGQNDFIGWSRDAAATVPEFTSDGVITFTIGEEDVQLYAIYKPYYLVQYNINNGTGNIPVDSTHYNIGDIATVKFNAIPLYNGNDAFMGWSLISTDEIPQFKTTGTTTLTITGDMTLYAIYNNEIYGVRGLDTSSSSLVRINNSIGMSYSTVRDGFGRTEFISDFDNVFPYNQMTKTTIEGNDFVYIPAMYWRIGYAQESYLTQPYITDISISRLEMMAGTNQVVYHSEAFYYGVYKSGLSNNKLTSVKNVTPSYSSSRDDLRTKARANGLNYTLTDLLHTRILQFLWLIEFATKNTINVMWGYTNDGAITGKTDSLTAPSGELANKGRMRYRYIEDFIGNGLETFDGVIHLSIITDPSQYTDDLTQVSQDAQVAFSTHIPNNADNLRLLGIADMSNPLMAVPTLLTSDSSYSTYFCCLCEIGDSDSYYYTMGRAGTLAKQGLFGWYNYRSSWSYHVYGRLMYIPSTQS